LQFPEFRQAYTNEHVVLMPSNPKVRASQQAEAEHLHVALSPECAVERDRRAAMELPNYHEARQPRTAAQTRRQQVFGDRHD